VAPEVLRVERWHLGAKVAFNSRGLSAQKLRQRRRDQSRIGQYDNTIARQQQLSRAGGGGSQVAVAGVDPEAGLSAGYAVAGLLPGVQRDPELRSGRACSHERSAAKCAGFGAYATGRVERYYSNIRLHSAAADAVRPFPC
jgi:hypothetical protein